MILIWDTQAGKENNGSAICEGKGGCFFILKKTPMVGGVQIVSDWMSRGREQEAEAVSQHYDGKTQYSFEQRKMLQTTRLRSFNNWIKGTLLAEYTRDRDRVLDLCCGRGGDLRKWARRIINYWIGVDISVNSLEDCIARYAPPNRGRGPDRPFEYRFGASFIAADCCRVSIAHAIPTFVDIVSCQFAFHYSFQTEETARMMLANVSCALKQGGYFVGTTPDSNVIVSKVREQLKKEPGNPKISNSIYSIEFDQFQEFAPFGMRYTFCLKDAIDNCPEYLVHIPTLKMLAREYGLEFVKAQNFHHFFQEKTSSSRDKDEAIRLLHKMNVFDEHGEFPHDDWEVAGLYLVFVFRKSHTPTIQLPKINEKRINFRSNGDVKASDIIHITE